MLVPVGVALGSNLGDRAAEIEAGVEFLRYVADGRPVRVSPRIETLPVNCPPGAPKFLNAVAEFQLDTVLMPPLNLLHSLQDYEIERGRSPVRDLNSPRPLDLDIIYYGQERFDQLGLVIPHPRAHERRFVLEPLSYLRPDLVLPGQTKTVRELLGELKD
jgi:2-amino-4-hydroxy-6-hydroxymethyldihydropteridine diphosphokinase